MIIIKEGEVIFKNGEIAEINNFVVDAENADSGSFNTLEIYVRKNYIFKGKK